MTGLLKYIERVMNHLILVSKYKTTLMIRSTYIHGLHVQAPQQHEQRRKRLREQARKQHRKILKDLEAAVIKRKQFEKRKAI